MAPSSVVNQPYMGRLFLEVRSLGRSYPTRHAIAVGYAARASPSKAISKKLA